MCPFLKLAAPRLLGLTGRSLSAGVGDTGEGVEAPEVHTLVKHGSAVRTAGGQEQKQNGDGRCDELQSWTGQA